MQSMQFAGPPKEHLLLTEFLEETMNVHLCMCGYTYMYSHVFIWISVGGMA